MGRRWLSMLVAAAVVAGLLGNAAPPPASAGALPLRGIARPAAADLVVGSGSGGPTWIRGDLQASQTWGPEGSPYVIDNGVRILSGVKLTMLPGTVVKFFPTTEDPDNPTTYNSSGLTFSGAQLIADGTPADPIVFTSYHDDTVGGDTNGAGRAPARGDWGSIGFGAPDNVTAADVPLSVMDNVSVRYGGEGVASPCQAAGTVTVRGNARLRVSSSEFVHSKMGAFRIDPLVEGLGYASVTNSLFADSGCGMWAQGGDVFNNVFDTSLDETFWSLGAERLRFYGNWTHEQIRITESDRTGADLRYNALLGGVEDGINDHDPKDLSYNWWGPDPAPESGCMEANKNYIPAVTATVVGGDVCPSYFWITGYFTKVKPMLASAPPMPEVGIGADPFAYLNLPDGQTLGTGSEFGYRPTGLQADPVNSATGSYVDEVTDAAVASVGDALAVTRTYNSADTSSGSLGKGWSFGYDVRLTFPDNQHAVFVAGDGQRLRYTKQSDGSWQADPGVTAQLTQKPDGSYAVTTRSQTTYAFDATGAAKSVLDRNGQGVTFAYDKNGRPTSATASGRSLKFLYNGSLLTRVTLPDGTRVSYGYTGGLLTSVRDLTGAVTTYGYDAQGRLTSETDPLGKTVMRLAYDATTGRVSDQWDALNHHTTFSWDRARSIATMTDPRGGEWIDDYAGNVLVSRTDPLGRTTSYQYDDQLQLTSAVNPRGIPTQLVYDENGDLVASSGPYGTVRTRYDANHDPVSSRNAKGTETRYSYDPQGNLTSVEIIPGDGSATLSESYVVDNRGLVTAATNAAGKTTTYTYNSQGDLTRVTSPEGRATTYGYDALGRLTSSVDPRGNVSGANPADFTTAYAYNERGQLASVTSPLGLTSTNTYDAAGRLVSSTDAKQRTTRYTYDEAGHPLSVQGPDPSVPATTATYDANGNIKSTTDPAGRTITYGYDPANQQTAVTGPLGTYSLGYDSGGNLTTVENPAGQTTKLTYTSADLLRSIDYPDTTPDVTYRYDRHGNRTAMDDGEGTVNYTYDALDRITQVTRGNTTYTYDYNKLGLITGATNPAGRSFAYGYDGDGLLSDVRDAADNKQLASYTYNAAALPKSGTLADGSSWTRQYDAAGRLTRLTDTGAGGNALLDDSLTLDAVGNPTQIGHADGSTDTYTYDQLDRLTAVCYGTTTCSGAADYVRWTYDPAGNRTSETRPAGTTEYSYAPTTGLLTSVTKPGGSSTTYTHDALGRLKTAGPDSYTYNLADRLTSATSGGTTTNYSYDGDGRRLKATSAAGTTNFLWDPLSYRLVGETDANANVVRSYAYGLGGITATADGAASYLHADAKGSVRTITDANGAVDWRHEYEPYGVVRNSEHVDDTAPRNPFGFAGEYTDPDGTSHLRARQYDPNLGAFTAPDPAAATSWSSTTTYANSNPMVYADPYGLWGDGGGVLDAINNYAPVALGFLGGLSPSKLGSRVLSMAVMTAGGAALQAWDTCSGVAKGSCGGDLVMGAVLTAGGYAAGRGIRAGAGVLRARAANGAPIAERLFTNRAVGVDSKLLGHSFARGESGLMNRTGSRLKLGWTSSGEFGGGWHLRLGVGRSPINPNQARLHWDFGSTHVPNSVANDLLDVIRGLNGL